VPRIRGSTTGDPLSSSVARALLGLATVNRVMPSGGPANRLRSTDVLGLWGTPNSGSSGPGSGGPRSVLAKVSAAPTCRSPMWRSLVRRSPPVSYKVSLDQVRNGGKDHISKWFDRLTLILFTVLTSVSSLMNSSVSLLKATTLITCLITNLCNELLITIEFESCIEEGGE
jgi:hypothetical protein